MVRTTRGSIHYLITQFLKLPSLQWFREEIGKHVPGGTVFNFNSLGVDLVLDEKISDVHVTRPFCAGASSVLFQEDGTCVVLIQDRFINFHALSVEEMGGPNQLRHNIVNTNNFGLGRASSHQFLLAGGTVD